jgi:hypothetical protein
MENRMEHTPAEQPQGWGAYASPPGYPAQQGQQAATPAEQGWCLRVREMLPALLENDGEIQPDMSAALQAHLAVCPGCGREFQAMSRVISLVEALGSVEIPVDLSEQIMRRIRLMEGLGAPEGSPPFGLAASSAAVFAGETEVRSGARTTPAAPTVVTTVPTAYAAGLQSLGAGSIAGIWERLLLGTLFAAIAVVLLLTPGARSLLGENVRELADWLQQVGEVLRAIPLLGALFGGLVSALGASEDVLEASFRSLRSGALTGAVLDGLIALIAYRRVARRGISIR